MLKYINFRTNQTNACPQCQSENVIVEEYYICKKQCGCVVYCKDCNFAVMKRTTKRAIRKWNKGC